MRIRLTSPAARLGAYGVVLAAAFGGGALAGATLGPAVDPAPAHRPPATTPTPAPTPDHGATDDDH